MALPKINAAPKYEAVVPSTKQTVRFRPYLVKEEKVLMMAMETQDQKQAMAAVVDTIESCVSEPIDKNKLTSLVLQLVKMYIFHEKKNLKGFCANPLTFRNTILF